MRQSLRESLIRRLGWGTIAVFLLMVSAAALLTQEGGSVWRAIGGAIVVMMAPFFLGMLAAFFGSLKPKGGDVFSKTAGIVIGGILVISITQIEHMSGKMIALVEAAASDFSMPPSLLWLMLPVSFAPGLLIMYDVYHSGGGTIVGYVGALTKLLRKPDGLRKVVAGELEAPEKRAFDEHETELKKTALEQATTYYRAEEYEISLAILQNFKPEKARQKDDRHFLMGVVLAKLDNVDGALDSLEQIQKRDRFEPGLSKLQGELCADAGRFGEAVQHLRNYKSQVGKPDAKTVRLLLTAFKGWYGKEASLEDRKPIKEDAQDFVGEVMGTGIISKGEVNGLWPGFFEEEGEE